MASLSTGGLQFAQQLCGVTLRRLVSRRQLPLKLHSLRVRRAWENSIRHTGGIFSDRRTNCSKKEQNYTVVQYNTCSLLP